jgi:hypothetical protein
VSVAAIETLKNAEQTAYDLLVEAENAKKQIKEQAEHKVAEYQTILDNQEIEAMKQIKQTIEKEFADIEEKMILDCKEDNEKLGKMGKENFDKAIQLLKDKVVK